MANLYRFNTCLEGYVQVARDAGKFHNRTFAYTIPAETLREVEADEGAAQVGTLKAEGCVVKQSPHGMRREPANRHTDQVMGHGSQSQNLNG